MTPAAKREGQTNTPTPASPAGPQGREAAPEGAAQPGRMRLPNRRAQLHDLAEFGTPTGAVHKIYVAAGYEPFGDEAGIIRECFLRGRGQTESEFNRMVDDTGVLISLLFQYGETPASLLAHLGAPGPDGEAQTMPRAVVEKLVDMQAAIAALYEPEEAPDAPA